MCLVKRLGAKRPQGNPASELLTTIALLMQTAGKLPSAKPTTGRREMTDPLDNSAPIERAILKIVRAAVAAEREQSRELREAALEVVGLIEAWEEAVRRIIGRIPETGIDLKDLNRLKAAIRQADGSER